jgi:hypothetical protein
VDIRIRQARPEDAQPIAGIAESLRLTAGTAPSNSDRGFLMAGSPEAYSHCIANDDVLVIEDRDFEGIAGFSSVIGPDTIVSSGLWEKTKEIRWVSAYARSLELRTSAIYDQIALDPRYTRRLFANHLAFVSLERVLSRYLRVFASVASYPIRNRASLPFLERMGWSRVGSTDEEYPGFGRIEYDIYCIERPAFAARSAEPAFAALGERARALLR